MSIDIINGTFTISNEYKVINKGSVGKGNRGTTIPESMPNNTKMNGRVGSMPARGTPNSSMEVYDDAGNLLQRRIYDGSGRARFDVDFAHSNATGTHEFPHIHEWDWSKVPPRQ